MRAREVPNWMLYDLMRDMKEDIAALELKLESKIDAVDARLTAVEAKLEAKIDAVDAKLEAKIDKNTERIEGLYLNQDKVKISFSRTFAFANAIFSGFVAYFTVLFTGEYQT